MVNDMGTKGYFGHSDSLGRSPWTRMGDCGNPTYGGENLAAGTERDSAAAAFELLRNSPSHNAVMLSPEFRLIGIARQFVAGSPYGWYWATDFGYGDAPIEAAAPPPPPPTAAPAAAVPVSAPAAPPKPQVAAEAPQRAAPSVAAAQPEPTAAAAPEPEPEVAAPPPMVWEGDAQLAAALFGSVAFEFGDVLAASPTEFTVVARGL